MPGKEVNELGRYPATIPEGGGDYFFIIAKPKDVVIQADEYCEMSLGIWFKTRKDGRFVRGNISGEIRGVVDL